MDIIKKLYSLTEDLDGIFIPPWDGHRNMYTIYVKDNENYTWEILLKLLNTRLSSINKYCDYVGFDDVNWIFEVFSINYNI